MLQWCQSWPVPNGFPQASIIIIPSQIRTVLNEQPGRDLSFSRTSQPTHLLIRCMELHQSSVKNEIRAQLGRAVKQLMHHHVSLLKRCHLRRAHLIPNPSNVGCCRRCLVIPGQRLKRMRAELDYHGPISPGQNDAFGVCWPYNSTAPRHALAKGISCQGSLTL